VNRLTTACGCGKDATVATKVAVTTTTQHKAKYNAHPTNLFLPVDFPLPYQDQVLMLPLEARLRLKWQGERAEFCMAGRTRNRPLVQIRRNKYQKVPEYLFINSKIKIAAVMISRDPSAQKC
jgi:hypothetical protein